MAFSSLAWWVKWMLLLLCPSSDYLLGCRHSASCVALESRRTAVEVAPAAVETLCPGLKASSLGPGWWS